MFTFTKTILVGIMLGAIVACPLSMEPTFNELLLKNNSDIKITILLNISYPDSTLAFALPDSYLDPKSQGYVSNTIDLRKRPGITLFVFADAYYESRWHENAGTPDKYLAEDSILQRYVLSKAQLDSLSWTVVFP